MKSFATKDRGVVVIEFENHLLPETKVEFEVCCSVEFEAYHLLSETEVEFEVCCY